MIPRYTKPPFDKLWSLENKFKMWLKVEIAGLEARVSLGHIKKAVVRQTRKFAVVIVWIILKIEKRTVHDMIAFTDQVKRAMKRAGVPKWIIDEFHRIFTSYDIEDPAFILLLRESIEHILKELLLARGVLRQKARLHMWTLMIARTHSQDAEPTTFGQLLLDFERAVQRSICRLRYCLDVELAESRMAGAVGNFCDVPPSVAERALERLGLKMSIGTTQIDARDRHAMVMAVLSVTAGTLERMALSFKTLMSSAVGECREGKKPGQKGSSAMPWKRNSIGMEQMLGLARVMRAYCQVAMENIATLLHREIDQSAPERIIWPDGTSLIHYMTGRMREMIERMEVFPERMNENLERTQGVWAGHKVRNALIAAGVPSRIAYEYVQSCSFDAIDSRRHVSELLREVKVPRHRQTAQEIVGADKLNAMFDVYQYIGRGIQFISDRAEELWAAEEKEELRLAACSRD